MSRQEYCIDKLRDEIEDMKCCRNCGHADYMDMGYEYSGGCDCGREPDSASKYCDSWIFDENTREERQI